MSERDPATPPAGSEDTIAPDNRAMDKPALATGASPKLLAALDETAVALSDALAKTKLDSSDFARGSGTPKPARRGRQSLAQGTQIGRFVVSGELGAGGMGVVYGAYDPKLDRKVAIKMLHEGISGSHRARLEREARAMAKLTHPNVVSVYEVGDFGKRLFVAMEFIDGKTLREWLAETKPDRKQILQVMLDAGRGLAAAHAADMVHRDFKPDNVLVGNDGRTRVSDFGLVSPVGQDSTEDVQPVAKTEVPLSPSALTQVGTVMGTPLYMAPEQHRGASADHRADQFSFCVTLWEALYEHTPYGAKSYEALVENVSLGRILPPPKANQGPAWIRRILTRGLRVDPDQRFASMNDLLAALEADPWRARRRLAAGAAILSITGAAAMVLAFGGDDPDAAVCQGAEAQMASVWNKERRIQIASAFQASNTPRATEVWAEAEGRLEKYASDWVMLRTESCKATHVHREQSAQLLGYSMDCFDRRLVSYRSVIELFSSSPNERVVANASKTAGDLPALATCATRSELEREMPMPEDPATRAEIFKLQDIFEQLRRLDHRGAYQEALALSEGKAARAEALGYPPLAADILILRAALQQTLGDPTAAEATFREAASSAARAKDDSKVAHVWIRVLDLLAAQGRLDEALAIETVARTSAERVPDAQAIHARLQNTLGGIYVAKGHYDDAFVAYEKALALQRSLGEVGNLALGPAISNMGLAYWYKGDILGAKASFEEALAIMLRDLGADHSQVAYARKNIADLDIQLGNDSQAREHYLEVLRIWTASLGPKHANLAYAYEQLARVAQRAGDLETALDYAQRTITIREEALGPENVLNVQSLSVAIEIYFAEGSESSIARAREYIEKALLILEPLGETGRAQRIYVLDSRAKLAESTGKLRDALADREEVLALRKATLGDAHQDTAYSLAQIARLSMRMKKPARAAQHFAAAQAIYDALPGYGDQDGVGMRRSRAVVLIDEGSYGDALSLLQEALEKAQSGTDTHGMIPIVKFEIAQLRYKMAGTNTDEGVQAVGEARALRKTLDGDQEELGKSIDDWLRGK